MKKVIFLCCFLGFFFVTGCGNENVDLDLEKIKDAILPKDSTIFEIEGGNHAQFGDYGFQKGIYFIYRSAGNIPADPTL